MIGNIVEVVRVTVLFVGHQTDDILCGRKGGKFLLQGRNIVVIAADHTGAEDNVIFSVIHNRAGIAQVVYHILFVVISQIGDGDRVSFFSDTDHTVDETLAITDRTYLLYEGKILKAGTAEDLANDEMVRRVYLGSNFELRTSPQMRRQMREKEEREREEALRQMGVMHNAEEDSDEL